MTDGIRKLRKLQIGKETTPGTAVAATAVLRVTDALLENSTELVIPDEDIGLLVKTDRSYIPAVAAKLSMGDNEATYEQLPYIFEAGIKQVGTGAADGTGSDKIYEYPLPTTTVPTIQTYTIEGGDNVAAEEMEYAFVKSFKLSGSPKEAVKYSAEWVGRQVSPSTFTPSLSIPTVEEILFQRAKLYIDPASGTIGSTLVSNTLLGFNLEITTGWQEVYTGSGQLYFSHIKNVGPDGTLEITFEHNSSAVSEKSAWLSQTARAIRINIEGSNVATAGTLYSKKTLRIDLVGKWISFEKLGEQDGNDILTGKLQLGYNATQAMIGKIIVVNELASLP